MEEIQLKGIIAVAHFFPALDKPTHVSHLSQFSVIARYVAGDALHEESLAALLMKGTTKGEDL